ncbi:hypothetical protein [Longispora urticae]
MTMRENLGPRQTWPGLLDEAMETIDAHHLAEGTGECAGCQATGEHTAVWPCLAADLAHLTLARIAVACGAGTRPSRRPHHRA